MKNECKFDKKQIKDALGELVKETIQKCGMFVVKVSALLILVISGVGAVMMVAANKVPFSENEIFYRVISIIGFLSIVFFCYLIYDIKN